MRFRTAAQIGFWGIFLSSRAIAAPVVDSVSPTSFSTPTVSEFSTINTFASTVPTIPAGSIVTSLRNGPTSQINTLLNAALPAESLAAQNNEVGILPVPNFSQSCPANTPVRVSISSFTTVLTAHVPAGTAGLGMGLLAIDTSNPNISAPISSGLSRVTPGLNVNAPEIVPVSSFDTTYGVAQTLLLVGSFDVVEQVEYGTGWVGEQGSHEVTDFPTVSFSYDDTGCGVVPPAATSVPTLQAWQLLLLVFLTTFVFMTSRTHFLNRK